MWQIYQKMQYFATLVAMLNHKVVGGVVSKGGRGPPPAAQIVPNYCVRPSACTDIRDDCGSGTWGWW